MRMDKKKMHAEVKKLKMQIGKAKKKIIEAEKKVAVYAKKNPMKALAIAAGVGAVLGAAATALMKRRK